MKKPKLLSSTISITLAVMMLAMSTGSAYASTVSTEIKGAEFDYTSDMPSNLLTENVSTDNLSELVNASEDLGFEVSNIAVNENNCAVIDLEYKGIESVVEVASATDQELSMKVTEGNLSNEVQVSDDGTMYIDGILVHSLVDTQTSAEGIVYMNAFQDTYQVKCPYGTASNYSKYYRTVTDNNIDWTITCNKLTTFMFAIIISGLFPTIGPTLELATILADYFKTYDPYSDCGSYITKEYFHTKGYFVSSTLAVRKCVSTVYSRHDFTGGKKAVTSYFCHSYTY